MINRFNKVDGYYVYEIKGHSRLGFYLTEYVDFYDMKDMEDYYGGMLRFYDFETGDVYEPFEVQRNVVYCRPVFSNDSLYFLKGDFNIRKIQLIRYYPGRNAEVIWEVDSDSVNLYNLQVIGNDVHVISQGDQFDCYYPENFSFAIGNRESVDFIEAEKVYFSEWEEQENEKTGEYKYFEYLIIRDFSGKILDRQLGNLMQRQDGSWWLG